MWIQDSLVITFYNTSISLVLPSMITKMMLSWTACGCYKALQKQEIVFKGNFQKDFFESKIRWRLIIPGFSDVYKEGLAL